MAVELVPYVQDEKKWIEHYVSQAMKQIRPVEMTRPLKEQHSIRPSIVLPTMQLAAQARSEMKREKEEEEERSQVFAPIKISPEFDSPITSPATVRGNGRKRKYSSTTTTTTCSKKSSKRTKSNDHDQRQKSVNTKKSSRPRDIFDREF